MVSFFCFLMETLCVEKVNPYPEKMQNADPSMREDVYCLPSGLITPENVTKLRTHCWPLQLEDWTLSNGHNQVSPSEWKAVMSSCITPWCTTVATLLLNVLGDGGSDYTKG